MSKSSVQVSLELEDMDMGLEMGEYSGSDEADDDLDNDLDFDSSFLMDRSSGVCSMMT